jgi:organic anion transporter 4A
MSNLHFQGMVVNGFVNAVISTLERRFDLTSTMTGVIAGSYDIGSMLTVIPITYFGGMVRKPFLKI